MAGVEIHRPPRSHPRPVPVAEFVIHAPPVVQGRFSSTLMEVLFPVLGSLAMVAFAFIYPNKLFLFVACGFVALSIVFSVGMRLSQKRQGKRSARAQRAKYRSYLAECEAQLQALASLQADGLSRLYPDPGRVWSTATGQGTTLWERRREDPDFLTVRVGRGPVPLACPLRLDLGANPMTEHVPELEREARELVSRFSQLEDMPVTLRLSQHPLMAITGAPTRARALARAVIAQLATFRAPNDLRLLVAAPPEELPEWEYLKWVPHARVGTGPEATSVPLLASAPEALEALLEAQLSPRIDQLTRLAESHPVGGPQQIDAPWLVIVIDDYRPNSGFAQLGLLRRVQEQGRELKVAVICLVERPEFEPSRIDARIRMDGRGAAKIQEAGPGGAELAGVWPDEVKPGPSEALARALAPLRLREPGVAIDVGDEVRLTDLRPAEARRPATRGEELRATIGVSADGKPLVLDLKQAAEGGIGPHGLVIGATGSGKSELLRTLAIGLATDHDPETLAFVFVDFKGGAAFAELSALPHCAGSITNLQSDAALIDRMQDALFGELERREQLLRDAGNLDDIQAYRRRATSDPRLPQLPYLLVIVDEFSELLAVRPEFIDLFVTVGRLGRSLGVHLLLCSQRLDEGRLRGLESHLRYRICLRTYSAIESKLVIGTADAHQLPAVPGLGILKVDTSLYERFKAALVSGPPLTERADQHSGEIRRFDPAAGAQAPQDGSRASMSAGELSELELLVATARQNHSKPVHQVWLAPLPDRITLDTVLSSSPFWGRGDSGAPPLVAEVGIVDHPREQRVEPLRLDFEGVAGHLAVVGAPRSGKSTAMRAMVAALARTHTPDEVRFYGIDLGGGLLHPLEAAPHVGSVCGRLERQRVRATIGFMRAELERRELMFRRHGVESMSDLRARRARGELDPELSGVADVFLMIDNYPVLRNEFEGADLEVEAIAGAGLGYGVHVAITANRWVEIRPALSENIGSRLELRLNDPLESQIGRAAAQAVPADTPGRGLTRDGFQLQLALPRLDGQASEDGLGDALASQLEQVAEAWHGEPAPQVRVLPSRVTAAELPSHARPGVTIGVDELALEPVVIDLERGGDAHFLVLGDAESGRTNLLRVLARGLLGVPGRDDQRAELVVVDYRRTLVDLAGDEQVIAYATNPPAVAKAVQDVIERLRPRLLALDPGDGPNTAPAPASGAHLYVLVDDYDLVAGPTGNPLTPLVDLLAHGRDVGLHVVLARRVGGTARAAFEPVYQRLTELRSPGLLMSGDREEGPLLGGHRATPLPPGRGLLVQRGRRSTFVQVLLDEARAEPDHPRPPKLRLAEVGSQ